MKELCNKCYPSKISCVREGDGRRVLLGGRMTGTHMNAPIEECKVPMPLKEAYIEQTGCVPLTEKEFTIFVGKVRDERKP